MNLLDELYHIFEENKNVEAENKLWKKCRVKLDVIPKESLDNITGSIHDYASECERLGFINGFCYGVQLMFECKEKDT